jgi:putative FmdB family regulatory protein
VPTYQYACTACDHRFEEVQSFTDPSLTECPECTGRLRKLYGSVGVVFKGSGFYRTDSRGGASTASEPAKSDSGSSNSSSPSSDSGASSGSATSTSTAVAS